MTFSEARVQPFYCPYCSEEDFVPSGDDGAYHCQSCNRRFAVRFLGLAPAPERAEVEEAP